MKSKSDSQNLFPKGIIKTDIQKFYPKIMSKSYVLKRLLKRTQYTSLPILVKMKIFLFVFIYEFYSNICVLVNRDIFVFIFGHWNPILTHCYIVLCRMLNVLPIQLISKNLPALRFICMHPYYTPIVQTEPNICSIWNFWQSHCKLEATPNAF